MQKVNNLNLKIIFSTKTALKFFCILFLSFSFVHNIFAAELSLSPATGSYNVGDSFSVRLRVSSPNTSINAVSSGIIFSNDTLPVLLR
jgi:hypothetical protein